MAHVGKEFTLCSGRAFRLLRGPVALHHVFLQLLLCLPALDNFLLQLLGASIHQRNQFLLAFPQLPDSETVCACCNQQNAQAAQQIKPYCLIKVWFQI